MTAMSDCGRLRPGEVGVAPPAGYDAGLVFIGRIETPWTSRRDCPRRGRLCGPVCRIVVFDPWVAALKGIEAQERLEVLYWLHRSRRDLVLQSPARDRRTFGTFALRSPIRPNPIGTSVVALVGVDGPAVLVRGLDCLDGTPLLDLKPERTSHAAATTPTARDDGAAGN
jgi:tRNA (adenine37-N6)-methyltransferase